MELDGSLRRPSVDRAWYNLSAPNLKPSFSFQAQSKEHLRKMSGVRRKMAIEMLSIFIFKLKRK
jgi:hypothetical protein